MKKTLRTNNSNNRIVILLMILGLSILLMSGCQQINDLTKDSKKSHADTAMNSNTVTNTNTNTTTNSNATANTNANSNATANSDVNANATVENSNASTEPAGTPKPPEVKAFENNLNGNWSSADERVVFSKDEIKFYDKNGSSSSFLTWKYNAVDEKTVEITDENGQKSKATMTFEDNNTTLKWKDKMGDFTYKREAAKP